MSVNDIVVVLPGIMGSTLHRNGHPVWEPSLGAVLHAVRTFGGSISSLQLPEGIGDDAPDDGVEPVALMPDLHILPGIWTAQFGYDALVERLRTMFDLVPVREGGPPGNLLTVPYDWRLSNRYNGRRLKWIVEPVLERWRSQGGPYRDARVIFVCHSMGGLVARWYIQREGGAELTRKLITLGTPHRGALSALDQLVNGVRKGPRPFRIDLTDFARSLPSLHQLLPQYACLQVGSDDALHKLGTTSLPDVSDSMVADAMRFHDELGASGARWWEGPFDVHPVQGQKQRTPTTARLSGGRLVASHLIGGADEHGDGTVPALSAIPNGLLPTDPAVRHVTERHGALQGNRSIFDELEGVLSAKDVIHLAGAETAVDVRLDEVFDPGEPIEVVVEFPDGDEAPVEACLINEGNGEVEVSRLHRIDGAIATSFSAPAPGAYSVRVRGADHARGSVAEVTAPVLVWDEAEG